MLDFGLVNDVATEDTLASGVHAVLRTPLYMPPESITNPHKVDARSDLYSLGAVAYMLITGTPVFSGASATEVCARHLQQAPDAMSVRLGREIPADLEHIVLSCLAKEPELRPKSALALRELLEGCAEARGWSADAAQGWWESHAAQIEARRSIRTVSASDATVVVGEGRLPRR